MNNKEYVKNNFFKLIEERNDNYGCVVRIFNRNEGIGKIPFDLIEYIFQVYPIYSRGDIHWVCGNCDKGVFDAVLVINSSKEVVNVYVCGILRRPFTKEAQKEYEKYFINDINYRLTTSFDNHYENKV